MADESKSGRFGNIKAQLSDGSTRLRFFGGLAVIVVAVIIAYVSLRKSVNPASSLPSQVATVPSVNAQQTGEGERDRVNPAYDQLLAKENAAQAAQAAQTGDSAVPVIRTGAASQHESAAPAQAAATSAANATASAPTSAEAAAREQAAQQQRQDQQRMHQEAVTAKATAMKQQVNLLITAWGPKDHASLSVREVPKENTVATTSTPATAGAAGAVNAAAAQVVKAGETFYVLPDTVANNGGAPTVTGVIQNGVLNGTRILGRVEMAQNADGPVLRFKTADVKGYTASQTIDAVAIDPSFLDVDHHYLLRTVAVLGSSFLSGYGDALLKGGQSQQVVASTTGTLVQTDPYSTKQLVQIGLGNVGKTVGNNIGTLINKAPTVSVDQKKAQAGFAIILLSDMTLK